MILVTGSHGYLGRILTKRLEDWRGYDLADGQDVMDSKGLRHSLSGVDSVIHLAGIVGERECSRDAGVAYRVNSYGTLNVVDLARRMGVQRLITVSTCGIYGKMGVYAESKVLAEVATRAYGYMVVRLASLYGGKGNSDSLPESFRCDAEDGKIVVYGENEWRPLVHVEDAIRALLFLLPMAITPQKFDVVGENMMKGELAKLIAEKYGAEVEVVPKDSIGYFVEGEGLKKMGFKYKWNVRKWLE